MFSRYDLFGQLKASRRLPLGHVERAQAERAVEKEYHNSRIQEIAFMRKLSKRYRLTQDRKRITDMVDKLCELVACRKVSLMFDSIELNPFSSAHYVNNEIHLGKYGHLCVVIHELAHHVHHYDRSIGSVHGEGFLWIEQFLFDLFLEEILPTWKLIDQGLG